MPGHGSHVHRQRGRSRAPACAAAAATTAAAGAGAERCGDRARSRRRLGAADARERLRFARSVQRRDARDDRERGTQINLSESLSRVPGISILNRQNYAQDLQLSIRGFGARSTFGIRGVRLIVDGIPATMPDGQGQARRTSTSARPGAHRGAAPPARPALRQRRRRHDGDGALLRRRARPLQRAVDAARRAAASDLERGHRPVLARLRRHRPRRDAAPPPRRGSQPLPHRRRRGRPHAREPAGLHRQRRIPGRAEAR